MISELSLLFAAFFGGKLEANRHFGWCVRWVFEERFLRPQKAPGNFETGSEERHPRTASWLRNPHDSREFKKL